MFNCAEDQLCLYLVHLIMSAAKQKPPHVWLYNKGCAAKQRLKSAYCKYSNTRKITDTNIKQVIVLVFNLLICTVKLQIIMCKSNSLLLRYKIASYSIWYGQDTIEHIYITSPSANIYEDSKLLQPTPPNIEFQKYLKMYFNFLGIDGTSGEPNLNRPIKASVTNPEPILTANAGVEGRFWRQIPRCVPIDSAGPTIRRCTIIRWRLKTPKSRTHVSLMGVQLLEGDNLQRLQGFAIVCNISKKVVSAMRRHYRTNLDGGPSAESFWTKASQELKLVDQLQDVVGPLGHSLAL